MNIRKIDWQIIVGLLIVLLFLLPIIDYFTADTYRNKPAVIDYVDRYYDDNYLVYSIGIIHLDRGVYKEYDNPIGMDLSKFRDKEGDTILVTYRIGFIRYYLDHIK